MVENIIYKFTLEYKNMLSTQYYLCPKIENLIWPYVFNIYMGKRYLRSTS